MSRLISFNRFISQVPFLNDDLGVAVLEIRESNSLPPPLSVSTKVASDMEITEVMTVGYRHCGTLKKFVESGIDIIMQESERALEAMEWLRVEERKHRCSLILDGEDHATANWNYHSKYMFLTCSKCIYVYRVTVHK